MVVCNIKYFEAYINNQYENNIVQLYFVLPENGYDIISTGSGSKLCALLKVCKYQAVNWNNSNVGKLSLI